MNAAAHSDLRRVKNLLAHGANPRQVTSDGDTALYEAIERRNLSVDNLPTVDALLKAGADPNEKENGGASALLVSLTRDYANSEVTLLLLQDGAVVPRDCGDGDSLVSLATQQSSIEVMRALLDKGAPPNCTYMGASALFWAVINAEPDRVALLLQRGADPTIEVSGQTLLEAIPSCPKCEAEGKANDIDQTRELIESAIQSRRTKHPQRGNFR
jgi:uncharacterized protein